MQRLWGNRIFVYFGYISYPIYLFHQNILVSSIVKIHLRFNSIPLVFLPVLPILLCIAVAWVVAYYGEPFVQKSIVQLHNFLSKKYNGLVS